MTPRIDALIAGYLDETLNEPHLRELESWINASRENAAYFARAVYLDDRLGAELRLKGLTDPPAAASPGEELRGLDLPANAVRRRAQPQRRRGPSSLLAFAAGIALLVAVGWQLVRTGDETGDEAIVQADLDPAPVAAFATVLLLEDVEWGVGPAIAVGERLSARSIKLRAGIVHLAMDSGVEVTLEGPAEYRLIDGGASRLTHGLLAATVPPGAEGFRVDTPSAKVVDLGTAFGLSQGQDGESRVSVFDGEVEVTARENESKRLLSTGESVRLDSEGNIQDVEFATKPFERLWPPASGIQSSTGAFQFTPPFPRRLEQIESDTNLFILPEGYPTVLADPCEVNLTIPGACASYDDLSAGVIEPGRRVRSYLLQFNPQDNGQRRQPGNLRRITGSITFQRPILGVIVLGEQLRMTDGRFSTRGGRVPQMLRGLELTGTPIGDVVTLDEDGHTLRLNLAAATQRDHLRVIVDASPRSEVADD